MSDDLKSELWKLTVESRKLRADIQRLEMMLSSVKSERDHAVQQIGDLRAENKRLRSENRLLHLSVAGGDNDLMRLLDKYAADCQAYFDQAEALCAENERLRKDAERWRFMRTNYGRLSADTLTGTLRIHVEPRRWGIVTPEDADAAIDAAMKATGSPESS